MSDATSLGRFDLVQEFEAGQAAGGVDLGPYSSHYQELFADALADGVITAEERERLDKAADNLGMDRLQIHELEAAMIRAYEAHTRVKVVERWAVEPSSLRPFNLQAAGDEGRAMLIAQIEQLTARVAVLEEELREARSHVNVEVDLSGLESDVATTESVDQLRARLRRDPTNPRLFAALFQSCRERGDLDGQYRAAQALRVLGEATGEHRAIVDQYRAEGLIAPKRSLSLQSWHEALLHPDLEVVTGAILALVAPAALVGRAAALRRDRQLPQVTESMKQDVVSSTVAAVRALGWSAAILGMPVPALFADPGRDVGYACVPNLPPYTLLGTRVLTGKSPIQQAFLAARHLTYYRAEFFAKVLSPGVQALEDLFLAALLLGSPSLPIADHLKQRAQPLSVALAPVMGAEQLDALRRQFRLFVNDGGRTNLLRWSESVDKTACRAGLLLADDLEVVAELLLEEEGPRGALLADLLTFTASKDYGVLRQRLGIAIERGGSS